MSTSLAMVLLLVVAGGYTVWQRSSLQRVLLGKQYTDKWFRGVFGTGAALSLALVMNAVSFMKLIWLATFGVGAIFDVSAGFGLRDIVRHVELLFGPPLVLSVELTIMWLVLMLILKNEMAKD